MERRADGKGELFAERYVRRMRKSSLFGLGILSVMRCEIGVEMKEKRTFGEMVAHFNREVAEMDIPRKYKMQLLGMITAIEMEHDSQVPKWIPVTEALPKNSEHDWVLGQIMETDSGYLWIPKVVEYRESSDDWFEESIGWLKKNPDHAFEVIAWMPLPEPWRGE